MKRKVLVLLMTTLMVLYPVLGVFADAGMVEGETAVSDQTVSEAAAAEEEAVTEEAESAEEAVVAEELVPETVSESEPSVQEEASEAEPVPVEPESSAEDVQDAPALRSGDGDGQCEHLNTETRYDYRDERIEDLDEYNHVIVHDVYEAEFCTDCWEQLTEYEFVYTDEIDWISHTYPSNDGICSECGHKCSHENTYDEYDKENGQVSYVADNSSYHEMHFTGNINHVCSNCQMVVSSEPADGEIVEYESHSWDDNDVCTVCGWENICEHNPDNVTTYIDPYDETYQVEYFEVEGDEKNHRTVGNGPEITRCQECGKILSRVDNVDVDVLEHHNYWFNEETGETICSDCGHVTGCSHSNYIVDNWDSPNWDECVPVDSTQHKAPCHGATLVCSDCGYGWYDPDREGDLLQNHEYEDGVCRVCGYECLHPLMESNTEYEVFGYEIIEGNESYHNTVYNLVEHRRCPDCGFEDDTPMDQKTEEEEHNFNEAGVCEDCGYENNCPHPSDDIDWYYDYNEIECIIEPYDEDTHSVTGEIRKITECRSCGQPLSVEDLGNTTVYEEHSYNEEDGNCYVCGYHNSCPHEGDTYVDYEFDCEGCVYTPNADGKTHHVAGEIYQVTYCDDCHQVLERVEIDELDEEHFFVDGVCESCGYENACEHPSSAREWYYDFEDCVYTPNDDGETHHIVGSIDKVIYCSLCQEELSREENVLSEMDAEHSWGSGGKMCTLCGYENPCTHSVDFQKTDYWYDPEEITVISTNGKQHTITGNISEVTYCENCGAIFALADVDTPITENHSYDDNGVCEVCGYVNHCTHPNMQVNEWLDDLHNVTYDKIDGQYHFAHFDVIKEQSCPDCGFSSQEVIGRRDIKYKHSFDDDGICVFCGYDRNSSVESGWVVDEAGTYSYYLENGEKATGVTDIDNVTYYFDANGVLQVGKWLKIGGCWHYFSKEARPENGYRIGYMVTNDQVEDGGYYYFLDADGKMVTGWREGIYDYYGQERTAYYYYDTSGKQVFKWKKIGTSWYYFDPEYDGRMATNNWVKDSRGWCYLDSEGRMVTNGWAKDSNGWCWIGTDGYMVEETKWIKYDGGWYYIEKGYRAQNTWKKDSKGWCYVGSDGRMVTNDWAKDSNGWCWIGSDGYMVEQTKWIKYDGGWYYIEKGYRVQNAWKKDSKGWCYVGSDGRMVTNGWAKDSKGWCWIGSDGYMVEQTKWIKYDGGWYYIEKGYRVQNSWKKDSGRMVTEDWAKDSKGWCWIGTDGYMVEQDMWIGDEAAVGSSYIIKGYRVDNKTIAIDGTEYTFDANGKLI